MPQGLQESGTPGSVVRTGSILWLALQAGEPPRAFHEIRPEGAGLYGQLHRRMLDAGVWMAPSAYEVAFLSSAHTEAHVDRMAESLDKALRHAFDSGFGILSLHCLTGSIHIAWWQRVGILVWILRALLVVGRQVAPLWVIVVGRARTMVCSLCGRL